MEAGCAVAPGSNRSRAASTITRRSSENGGSVIAAGSGRAGGCRGASRFRLPLGIERFSSQLAIGFLQENLYSPLGLFQLLLAFARECDAFFEELHRVVQRKLWTFQAAYDFLKPSQRAFKVGLLWWLRVLASS